MKYHMMLNRRGISLIEIVVALVIVAILAAAALPVVSNVMRGASEAATRGGLGTMRAMLTLERSRAYALSGITTNPTLVLIQTSVDTLFASGDAPTNKIVDSNLIVAVGGVVACSDLVSGPTAYLGPGGAPLSGPSAWGYDQALGRFYALTDDCLESDPIAW